MLNRSASLAMSTSVLKALPGKLDIKRHSPSILNISTQEGQAIPVTVDITVNHLGWMEFRLCPNNNIHRAITHDCLNRHVLALADGSGNRFVFLEQLLEESVLDKSRVT